MVFERFRNIKRKIMREGLVLYGEPQECTVFTTEMVKLSDLKFFKNQEEYIE